MGFEIKKSEGRLRQFAKRITLTLGGLAVYASMVAEPYQESANVAFKVIESRPIQIDSKLTAVSDLLLSAEFQTDTKETVKISEVRERTAMLAESIRTLGEKYMDLPMRNYWTQVVLPAAAEIPFQSVRAQYDRFNEAFFMTFHFKMDRAVTATIYPDEECEEAVFSVSSRDETFLQSSLPVPVFFEKVKNLWNDIDNLS